MHDRIDQVYTKILIAKKIQIQQHLKMFGLNYAELFFIKYPPQNTSINPNIAFKLNCPCKNISDNINPVINATELHKAL